MRWLQAELTLSKLVWLDRGNEFVRDTTGEKKRGGDRAGGFPGGASSGQSGVVAAMSDARKGERALGWVDHWHRQQAFTAGNDATACSVVAR